MFAREGLEIRRGDAHCVTRLFAAEFWIPEFQVLVNVLHERQQCLLHDSSLADNLATASVRARLGGGTDGRGGNHDWGVEFCGQSRSGNQAVGSKRPRLTWERGRTLMPLLADANFLLSRMWAADYRLQIKSHRERDAGRRRANARRRTSGNRFVRVKAIPLQQPSPV